jgi:hypothetical protein
MSSQSSSSSAPTITSTTTGCDGTVFPAGYTFTINVENSSCLMLDEQVESQGGTNYLVVSDYKTWKQKSDARQAALDAANKKASDRMTVIYVLIALLIVVALAGAGAVLYLAKKRSF